MWSRLHRWSAIRACDARFVARPPFLGARRRSALAARYLSALGARCFSALGARCFSALAARCFSALAARCFSALAARLALAAALLVVAVAGAALAGCGPGEARAPNPMRALDERRAIEVIRRAMSLEGVQPAPGREVELVGSKKIRIDVGVQDREYGVAYVSEEDAQSLGEAIPPPNRQDEKLRIVRAGRDGETRVVLLYQGNYLYDDLVGESHERTTITAERQLTRDAQDFITYARTQKFK